MKRNIQNITTKKLKEILSENYTRGINGADYEELKSELEDELWTRQDAEMYRLADKMAKYSDYRNEIVETEIEYSDFK